MFGSFLVGEGVGWRKVKSACNNHSGLLNQYNSLLGSKVTESVVRLEHNCHILPCCHT